MGDIFWSKRFFCASSRVGYNWVQWLAVVTALLPGILFAGGLADTVAKIKPSIVGIGSYQADRAPQSHLMGTGFVIADGYHVVTNAHVVDALPVAQDNEKLVVFVGAGPRPEVRSARILIRDEEHDLVILRLKGAKLPPLPLGNSDAVREGEQYAFTGFPIGAVLGLYPVTHGGIIASISPNVIPLSASGQLNASLIKKLKNPYRIFQLDATAYPGNSGSPLYRTDTGDVVGIINKVFVKQSKESVLEKPSGITYAIPAKYLETLLKQLTAPPVVLQSSGQGGE